MSENNLETNLSKPTELKPNLNPSWETQDYPDKIKDEVIGVLKTVFDPEIPVNIYELGLIYNIEINPPGNVAVKMTLTSPACPVAGSLPGEVETKVKSVSGVTDCKVELVWDPPWNPSLMSEVAKLKLNMF